MGIYTNQIRDDGFGAQLQSLLWTILWVEINNHEFVYTEIDSFHHNYENDPLFVETLNTYMAIKKNYINIKDIQDISSIKICNIPELYTSIESNIDFYHNSEAIKKFKGFFYKEKISPFDSAYFNVAIHIRRTNSHDSRALGTTVPNTYHIDIIKKICNDNPSRNIKFHIYSQGNIEDFQEIVNLTYSKPNKIWLKNIMQTYNIEFHLNESVLNTFNGMIFADILTTTTSSFSYVAGLISNGIIYYKPFWHPPLSKWIIC